MTTVADLTKVISIGFTDTILEKILQKKSGFSNVTVCSINLGSPSSKGDSYLSSVTKFSVKAKGNNGFGNNEEFDVHVIVKSIPRSPARIKTFRSTDFFDNEMNFYNNVWPSLDAFQKSKKLSELYDSIPLCLATFADGKNDFIALEDLSYQGYATIPRSSGIDLEMALYILKNFAKFHAISVAYKEENPIQCAQMIESLQETYFDEKFRKWYIGSMNKFCEVAQDAAEKELPSRYLTKLNEVMSQDLFGNVCKVLKEKSPLSALTHGDCWAPNFLIQESAGKRNLVLIDFQLMRWSSLTTDVFFFLYACVDPAVRDQNWDLLLKQYYENFTQVLNELGYKSNLSFDLLQNDMKRNGIFALAMCMEALTMSLLDDDDVADIDAIKGDEEIPLHEVWIIKPIQDSEKRPRIANFLKHLIDNEFI